MSEAGVDSAARQAPPRVLLLVPARTYRAADFLTAAGRMGLDLVIGSDGALPLGGHPVVHVSPTDLPGSISQIMALGKRFDAVVAADTPMLVLAAVVAQPLGPPHNPGQAVDAPHATAAKRPPWAAPPPSPPQLPIR